MKLGMNESPNKLVPHERGLEPRNIHYDIHPLYFNEKKNKHFKAFSTISTISNRAGG
jgi:hypothetical protein